MWLVDEGGNLLTKWFRNDKRRVVSERDSLSDLCYKSLLCEKFTFLRARIKKKKWWAPDPNKKTPVKEWFGIKHLFQVTAPISLAHPDQY